MVWACRWRCQFQLWKWFNWIVVVPRMTSLRSNGIATIEKHSLHQTASMKFPIQNGNALNWSKFRCQFSIWNACRSGIGAFLPLPWCFFLVCFLCEPLFSRIFTYFPCFSRIFFRKYLFRIPIQLWVKQLKYFWRFSQRCSIFTFHFIIFSSSNVVGSRLPCRSSAQTYDCKYF